MNGRIPLLLWLLVMVSLLGAACTSAPDNLADYPEWDLVFISDSSGWHVGEIYAKYIEEETGIPVNLHDASVGGLSAGQVLAALQGEHVANANLNQLSELIPEAEVVVFFANPEDSVSDTHPGDWNCTTGSLYVNDCSRETFDAYAADLDAIYEEVFALRGDAPIIVRAFDIYNFPGRWEEYGVSESCPICWETFLQVVHERAEAHNVPVAHVYDAFTGPDHLEDPREQGYTLDDGIHLNEAGRAVTAGLLRDLGYSPTPH